MINWISTKDKLPDKNKKYLVTFEHQLGQKSRDVDVMWYGNITKDRKGFYEWDMESGSVEWDTVLAWMPLPEPYQEVE